MLKNMYQADEKSSSRLKELSGNWPKIQLGNISEVQSGGTPLCSIKEYWDGNIAWYSSGELNNAETSSPERKITQIGLKNSNAKLFPKGSLLIGIYDTAALKMSILDRDAAFNQAVVGVKPKEGVNLNFILYYISAKKDEILSLRRGVRQKNLSLAKIKDIEILLPPLPEQTRIVAILDEAFANISQAVANAEKNLANARELFDSYLNEVFTRKGEEWEEKTLGYFSKSVCTGPFGSMLHKSDYVSEGVPLVNPINISGHSIIPDSSKLIDAETKKRLAGYVLSVGDVVVARRGEIGRCAAINEEQDGWICGTGCFFVTPSDKLNSEFLVYLLQSGVYRERLEAVATGATMKNLSNSALAELLITVPSIKAQEKLLEEFSDLIGKVEELEDVYRRKLAALAELKQALLQKAFTGELTAADQPT